MKYATVRTGEEAVPDHRVAEYRSESGGKGEVYPKYDVFPGILLMADLYHDSQAEMRCNESPYRTRLCSIRKNRKCAE